MEMEDLSNGSKMLAAKLTNLSKSKDMKNAVQKLIDYSTKSDIKKKMSCQYYVRICKQRR